MSPRTITCRGVMHAGAHDHSGLAILIFQVQSAACLSGVNMLLGGNRLKQTFWVYVRKRCTMSRGNMQEFQGQGVGTVQAVHMHDHTPRMSCCTSSLLSPVMFSAKPCFLCLHLCCFSQGGSALLLASVPGDARHHGSIVHVPATLVSIAHATSTHTHSLISTVRPPTRLLSL